MSEAAKSCGRLRELGDLRRKDTQGGLASCRAIVSAWNVVLFRVLVCVILCKGFLIWVEVFACLGLALCQKLGEF